MFWMSKAIRLNKSDDFKLHAFSKYFVLSFLLMRRKEREILSVVVFISTKCFETMGERTIPSSRLIPVARAAPQDRRSIAAAITVHLHCTSSNFQVITVTIIDADCTKSHAAPTSRIYARRKHPSTILLLQITHTTKP